VDEFDLIRRYFKRPRAREETLLGIGDDCALLDSPQDHVLAATMDTLVEGVHFFPDVDPGSLGHKALAVNLSDLAAMGAEPAWAFLALTIPEADPSWLEAFSHGMFELARRYQVDLAGGDTTRGPLSITLQALGWIPNDRGLRRSAAHPGDEIFVSGRLGDAGLALKMLRGEVGWRNDKVIDRLLRPQPRVELGLALRGIAHACIDISDGLAADLSHLLEASGLGATIEWNQLPMSAEVQRYIAQTNDWRLPLHAGDDYELCFTVPSSHLSQLEQSLPSLEISWHRIGKIEEQQGLRLAKGGERVFLPRAGYRHF